MASKFAMKETFRFDQPGTLVGPGPIGRVVRLLLGAQCLWLVWQLAVHSGTPDLYNPSFWVLAVLGLMLAPYVVNIGFGVEWGAWPRIASVAIILGAAAVSYLTASSLLSFPLWATMTIWMIYIYAHLGVSFVLSAMLATPGCEMRAIPQLFGLVFKQGSREHYCPGFIDNIDKWEHGRHTKTDDGDELSAADRREKDILGNAGGQLLVYGVPFLALQLAGNLAGFTLATAVPAIAFLFVGVVCSYNAIRSRRVHCYFLAPWCLLAGAMTALYSLRIIDFGPSSWSLIVNTGLAGAAVLYVASERIWGRYFGQE
ncbi:MAG: hypothetical protein OER97_05010 [Gammaproteobacteria bacterium]|nr:hypothetical protein [Gammaproteobacteria bacterium]